ncbi:hypothetical protein BBK82_33440 [Lentzea guizhouensis]|uniref:non-specific serine/threonine protein kinase n=1 Tax=Lentzea guizhouensis TaxID=1586287 RepID=A0A1B2HR52_9PSEU|nr:serine/threonine-protein kinase [Lentzea guizhouensis]ANZ40210.1 hypothetical protein BBK82_33440 [Lentzea guizhouensis]
MSVSAQERLSAQERVLAGRYELAERLGAGGMAEVHRAWDRRLHRHVAVKLFRAGTDATGPHRFENEVKTLAALSHPGLVQVHDAGTSDDTPFVVLQMVEGRTLLGRIADGPLSVEEIRRIGAQLADALAYVHEQGVVHRDVKPSNILLDHDGVAHLADFGLAQLIGATRLTRPDQLVGTAAYLAPEQVRGDEITCAVDVYALGLVLLECLTGRREYEGSEVEAAVARLHRRPDIPRDLPPDLKRLLNLMTSLPARRRPSAAECAAALRHVPTRTGMALPAHRPVRMLVAAGAFALAATAGVTAALNAQSPPAESAPPTTTAPGTSAPEMPATPVVASTPPPASATQVVPVQAVPVQVVPVQVVPVQAPPQAGHAKPEGKGSDGKKGKNDKGKGGSGKG